MRILTVVGTRPQLIKAAAVQPLLRRVHEEVFVDTGQHYDDELAGNFFTELGLAPPDRWLGIGGGGHAEQTGRMLVALDPILTEVRPDLVLVYGDTNSTLAGAIAGAKAGIPVAHVEAGLRSFDRRMPEELNRIVADHLSAWLFAPSETAVANLAAEGITRGVVNVGDVLRDLCARTVERVRDPAVLDGIREQLGLRFELTPGSYLLATVHRAENREPGAVAEWLTLLDAVAHPQRPVVLLLHPGTREVLRRSGLTPGPHTFLVQPLGYASTLALQLHAAAVLTDSGGIQRESGWLGTPCLVLRSSTEWVESVGTPESNVVLVGRDAQRGVLALERLAPLPTASDAAALRARDVRIEGQGAAAAIVKRLSETRAGVAENGRPQPDTLATGPGR